MKWNDESIEELMDIVDNGWCWQWPGWQWVANTLQARTRTKVGHNPDSCRHKYNAICAAYRKGKKRPLKSGEEVTK
jgi:hypothetical protein